MKQGRIPDYSVTGEGRTTVFLLHGAFGAKEYWRSQLDEFSARGYRVVAWDAPGYGLSPLPGDFSAESSAEALVRLLELTGSERNVVIGHSFGGMIAQRAFDYLPDRIHGLVLSATSAAFGNLQGEWQQKFISDRVAPLDAGKTLAQFAPGMLRGMMSRDAAGEPVELVVRIVSQMKPETFRAAVAAVTRFDARAVLSRMNIPVLCIAGEFDQTAPAVVMEKLAGKIKDAEFVCLKGTGHFGWAEAPGEFNKVVLDFLHRRLPA